MCDSFRNWPRVGQYTILKVYGDFGEDVIMGVYEILEFFYFYQIVLLTQTHNKKKKTQQISKFKTK